MKKFFGALILAAGILIAGLSGLCAVVVLLSSMTASSSDLEMVLMFSGVPLAIGIGLIFGGRALIRSGYDDDRRGM